VSQEIPAFRNGSHSAASDYLEPCGNIRVMSDHVAQVGRDQAFGDKEAGKIPQENSNKYEGHGCYLS